MLLSDMHLIYKQPVHNQLDLGRRKLIKKLKIS